MPICPADDSTLSAYSKGNSLVAGSLLLMLLLSDWSLGPAVFYNFFRMDAFELEFLSLILSLTWRPLNKSGIDLI